MSTEKANYAEIFPSILQQKGLWDERSGTMFSTGGRRLPVFGQYVMIGFGLAPLLYQIGYVVQVRLRQGACGTDLYLLRHCNGEVCQHANNMLLPLTPEEVEKILPCFGDVVPSAEGENPTYGLGSPETRRQGFIIDERPVKSPGTKDSARSYG